ANEKWTTAFQRWQKTDDYLKDPFTREVIANWKQRFEGEEMAKADAALRRKQQKDNMEQKADPQYPNWPRANPEEDDVGADDVENLADQTAVPDVTMSG